LGILVQPSGERSFFWFRKVQGFPTWKTIGRWPDVSVEHARDKTSDLNKSLAKWRSDGFEGPDPFDRPRGRVTLATVLEDYIERYLREHAKDAERAIKDARWQVEKYVSGWKARSLGSISRSNVEQLAASVGQNHGPYTANRLLQLLRRLFNWSIEKNLWQGANPVAKIELFPEHKRARRLQPVEMRKFLEALSAERNADLKDFVILALFTGARKSDVLSMRWRDLREGKWIVPNPKNREPYEIPLTREAVAVLARRTADRKDRECLWVFPSRGESGHVVNLKRTWEDFRKRAGVADLRIHDLRRTLGSWQADAGVSQPIIGKSLGHKSLAATEIYSRVSAKPVRDAVEQATRAMLRSAKMTGKKLLEAPRE
jgi:integrase